MYVFNNNNLFLEIKDSTFTTISTIDLSQYAEAPKVNNTGTTQVFQSVIQGEYLYILTAEANDHVLYCYHLKKVSDSE